MDEKERWARKKEIFSSVVEQGPDGWVEALAEACQGDEGLLRALRPMVEEHFGLRDGEAIRPRLQQQAPDSEQDLPRVLGGRFRVIARLGSGGFGDVYRVADSHAGGETLALKVLRSSNAQALQYFKREFRSLSGVFHRNIVALRELINYRDRWMFTMEFIEGFDLLRYLGSRPAQDRDAALRSCLMQTAEGLKALHERNLLHRDLKPSNMLVTDEGRLVLLDFGLVRSLGEDLARSFSLAGTPDYMSPEQAGGAELGEASDWYSVGVILYQALTGSLPFHFDSAEALWSKRRERPVAPAGIADVPADLNGLCLKLLDPDPRERASYEDVLRIADPSAATAAPRETPGALFLGREEPLRQLHEAYAMAEERPVLAHLRGASGMGKTVLLREFVSQIRGKSSTLVFSGRCYEGESVPFQAVDDLIDRIGRYLAGLPHERIQQLLPRNFAALAKMFPVLSQFLVGHEARLARIDSIDLRTRAFAALREMLGRFSERNRVVLAIDDLQWGGVDGVEVLNDLLSSSDSPPILAVLAYRSEDAEANPWLKMLQDTAAQPSGRQTVFIDLNRLDRVEAEKLAGSLLAADANPEALRHVVDQSGGNPFLLQEIVRWVKARGVDSVLTEAFSLGDVVRSRVARLSAGARRLLESIAVAGQPTPLPILQTAAGLATAHAARDELIAARFIRSRAKLEDEVEVYHDRIGETVVEEMDGTALVERHRGLALALASADRRNLERIVAHFQQAHEPERCGTYALQAARRAAEVLAFNKAASFFEMAIATKTLGPADLGAAHRECADALANAGRGAEAAGHYLAACEGATTGEQLERHLSAGEQLLYSGHIDRGLDIFRNVLAQVRLKLPSDPWRIRLDLVLRRARLRIRGLHWRETVEANVPRNALLKIDTCASVATGLSLVDVACGAALQTTNLLLALRAGEPRRIARALAMEAAYASTGGPRAAGRAARLLEMASSLSSRTGDQRAKALTAAMTAGCAWNAGRWAECIELAGRARRLLRDLNERVVWERDTASIFEVEGLRWMGRWSAMKAILPELLEDARLRGDLYVQAILQMHAGSCAELANDNPAQALAGLSLLERWSNKGFHVEHLVETHNQVEIALYRGEGRKALSLVAARWPALRASLLLHVHTLHIQMRSLRGRAAVAAASEQGNASERRDLLRLAEQEERAIRKQGAAWGNAMARFIQAGRQAVSGDIPRAVAALTLAEAESTAVDMFLHAAVARWWRSVLEHEADGIGSFNEAYERLKAEGIADPRRLASVVCPGIEIQ